MGRICELGHQLFGPNEIRAVCQRMAGGGRAGYESPEHRGVEPVERNVGRTGGRVKNARRSVCRRGICGDEDTGSDTPVRGRERRDALSKDGYSRLPLL